MVQAKHIAALLIAACLASTGAAATPLEPPSADGKVTVEPRGRAYLFRGLISLIDWGMDELAQRINRTGGSTVTFPSARSAVRAASRLRRYWQGTLRSRVLRCAWLEPCAFTYEAGNSRPMADTGAGIQETSTTTCCGDESPVTPRCRRRPRISQFPKHPRQPCQ
jgi:hypothetical protein